MPANLTQKLIGTHLLHGTPTAGEEIALAVDQVLLQDVLGTLVMLELEAMGVERVKVDLAAQYIDHNLVQNDHLNGDEQVFLRSAARRYGVWYSRAGNGISHPVHMQRFGKPGQSMIGCDSHTPAAGSLGMLAFGAGGVEVALAMAGEPIWMRMPEVWGIRLTGHLPDWVSAKDVILEMLRRHGVAGGIGTILEYHGPGLAGLSAMDRHVIANMGAELGATSTIFPSDATTLRFLQAQGRADDWQAFAADAHAAYDREEEIDLATLEPLIARPSSPGNVVPVADIVGLPIGQAYIGSSANPGFRDFAITAAIVKDRQVHDGVSLDVNPSSRQILEQLIAEGHLAALVAAGARIHQCGCNGCIGMGQAPATGRNSLRTVPRNFPGRSGTLEDSVFLCSPETAAASALVGAIADPRTLDLPYPRIEEPERVTGTMLVVKPLPADEAQNVPLEKTANITSLPSLDAIPDTLDVPVMLKVGDDVSTDDIIPAGARVMPYWSHIPKVSAFAFESIDGTYAARAQKTGGAHAIVAGGNYGQGSSRENAALAPRFLGLSLLVAKSIARIHWQNLVNFGALPLVFDDAADYDKLADGARLTIANIRAQLRAGSRVTATIDGVTEIVLRHSLSSRQIDVLLAGGVINWMRRNAES